MYVRKEFHGELGSAMGETVDCPSMSPDSRFVCTLARGHRGKHIAGVDLSMWLAEWDDDRSTDPKADCSDFFAEIGL